MNGKLPHIVQYQGSKRILAPQILQYIPKKINRLIEPFSGMAAITIAVAMQKRASHYIINDLNEPLVRVLSEAVNDPFGLVKDYKKIWEAQFDFVGGSIEHYYKVRDDFNAGDRSAANMLYLLARCVKGAVRYSNAGCFNQSPDKRRNGTSPKNIEKNISIISSMLKGKTDFMSKDYREVLKLARPGDVVYMDPPYQGVCSSRDNRYFSGIDFDEFVEAIEGLNKRKIDYIISYDGSCGDKRYGVDLPEFLGLKKVLLNAGLSSQSLLLGKKEVTFESLYLSKNVQKSVPLQKNCQLSLF
ncbi:DNA adenine methylase [uncultured Phocaeicola sp.]|uniref:DNA adenine methylase n=1 Tax=uncultured Phocaeicola sp. TaxID=990718 RepID=UPI0025D1C173|nr:DNA adenine methylase [uncultured Phocaeicola sp.]